MSILRRFHEKAYSEQPKDPCGLRRAALRHLPNRGVDNRERNGADRPVSRVRLAIALLLAAAIAASISTLRAAGHLPELPESHISEVEGLWHVWKNDCSTNAWTGRERCK